MLCGFNCLSFLPQRACEPGCCLFDSFGSHLLRSCLVSVYTHLKALGVSYFAVFSSLFLSCSLLICFSLSACDCLLSRWPIGMMYGDVFVGGKLSPWPVSCMARWVSLLFLAIYLMARKSRERVLHVLLGCYSLRFSYSCMSDYFRIPTHLLQHWARGSTWHFLQFFSPKSILFFVCRLSVDCLCLSSLPLLCLVFLSLDLFMHYDSPYST